MCFLICTSKLMEGPGQRSQDKVMRSRRPDRIGSWEGGPEADVQELSVVRLSERTG